MSTTDGTWTAVSRVGPAHVASGRPGADPRRERETDTSLAEEFERRRVEVRAYGRTWWLRREEPQKSFLATRPALRAQLLADLAAGADEVPTTRLYETGVGQWAPERKREHRNVLGGLLRPAVGPGAVYVLLGLPGSGKTSVLRPAVLAHSGVPPLVSDADEVRVALPEFRRGLGSAILQEETAALVYGATGYPPGGGLQDRVLAAGGVALLDVVGDPRYLPATVAACRSWGSRVFLLLAECPTEACVERAMRRAVIDGRYVPLDYIRAKEGVPRQALDVALAEGPVDGWAVVDTSGAPARLLDGDGAFSAVLAAA